MTYTHRPKPTAVIVCDLCDEEIERDADGSTGRANLMVYVSPIIQVTNRTNHALLCWGKRRVKPQDDPIPTANYDFHGGCIARLVEQHVQARALTEADR